MKPEVGGGHGEEDEPGVELLGRTDQMGHRAVLDEVAVSSAVEAVEGVESMEVLKGSLDVAVVGGRDLNVEWLC